MTSRRHFLQTSAITGLAASSAAAQGGKSANDKIRFALIGAGGMGSGDANSALAVGGTELVAVADIYEGRLTRAKERWGKQVAATRDYREILDRKDIDAVIVATPDHWHQTIAIEAMIKGKDVYCEKPMIQQIGEGQAMVDAQKKTGRIIQVGSQRVSSVIYQKAQDLIRAGAIGEVNMIEAWWDRNSAIGAWQYSIPPDATPENIDWDRFLGDAPKRPFEAMRLFRWRNYQDYGTGVAGDLFVHLFSGMHFITGSLGPSRIYSTGGLRFWKDGRDVPDVMLGLYDYEATDRFPAFTLSLRVNFVCGAQENSGFRFIGSEGVLSVDDEVTVAKQPRAAEPGFTVGSFAEATQRKFIQEYRKQYPFQRPTADAMRAKSLDRYAPPRGYNDHADHLRNFIEAVRTRRPVIEDAAFGLRAAGPAVLSNVSYAEGKPVEWNPQTMTRKA